MKANDSLKQQNDSSFFKWLKSNNKIDLGVASATLFSPIIVPLIIWVSKIGKNPSIAFRHDIFELLVYIAHVFLILYVLFRMLNMDYLIKKDRQEKLKGYVKNTFRENSDIWGYSNDSTLIDGVNNINRQFFYGWIIIWGLWLIMYIDNSIYKVLTMYYHPDNLFVFEKIHFFFHDGLLNLFNSVVVFFLYFILSESSNKSTMISNSKRTLKYGSLMLAIIIAFTFSLACYSLLLPETQYKEIKIILCMIINTIAVISLIALLGKLNSSFLNIPQYLILFLYLYAAMQMLNPNIMDLIGKDSNSTKIIMFTLYFLGKICLFFIIKWIFHDGRFTFFVLHKSDSLREAGRLLINFNQIFKDEK